MTFRAAEHDNKTIFDVSNAVYDEAEDGVEVEVGGLSLRVEWSLA